MSTEPNPTDSRVETKPTRRIGQGMLLVAFATFLGLMTWFMDGRLDLIQNPNPNPQAVGSNDRGIGVVLRRNRFGHYVATGRINGQDVVFLLDTGASNVSIPARVASRLGLERGASRRVQTANGTIDVHATNLESVELGPIRLDNVHGGINPHMEGEQILLGMSFLKHLDWRQRGSELTLMPRQ